MEYFFNVGGKEANPAAFPTAKDYIREFAGIKTFYKHGIEPLLFFECQKKKGPLSKYDVSFLLFVPL